MQERKTYAKGSLLESTTGYVVKVGMPVVDDTVTASEFGSASFTALNPITDGQYLVTLEVNGEAIAYKETVTLELGEVSVGEYGISYDADYASMGVTAGDIVRLLIEPLEVSVSDGFRAAINKAVPKSGGGSGGGVLVVTDTDGTLDKTWQDIYDADFAVVVRSSAAGKIKYAVTEVMHDRDNTVFSVNLITGANIESYTASSADGYPTLFE